jgi:hypothetical protein
MNTHPSLSFRHVRLESSPGKVREQKYPLWALVQMSSLRSFAPCLYANARKIVSAYPSNDCVAIAIALCPFTSSWWNPKASLVLIVFFRKEDGQFEGQSGLHSETLPQINFSWLACSDATSAATSTFICPWLVLFLVCYSILCLHLYMQLSMMLYWPLFTN